MAIDYDFPAYDLKVYRREDYRIPELVREEPLDYWVERAQKFEATADRTVLADGTISSKIDGSGDHGVVVRIRYPRRVRLERNDRLHSFDLGFTKPMSGWRYRRLCAAFAKAGILYHGRSRILNSDQLESVSFGVIVASKLVSTEDGLAVDLYLDSRTSWRALKKLIRALVAADLVSSAWAKEQFKRGAVVTPAPVDL